MQSAVAVDVQARIRSIKPLFLRGPSPTLRVTLATLCAIGLIIADHRFDHLDRVRSFLSLLAYPLQLALQVKSLS